MRGPRAQGVALTAAPPRSLPLDLGCRGEENRAPVQSSGPHHALRAEHIGLQGAHGILDDESYPDGSAEVTDRVDPRCEPRHQGTIGDRADVKLRLPTLQQGLEVLASPCGEIVKNGHLVARCHEMVGEV